MRFLCFDSTGGHVRHDTKEIIHTCSLRELWQGGRLYESDAIKKACIAYAKQNPLAVLFKGALGTSLQAEDPDSWDEFHKAITILPTTIGQGKT